MDRGQRKEILARGYPEVPIGYEPELGGVYTEEEVEAMVLATRESMEWRRGDSASWGRKR